MEDAQYNQYTVIYNDYLVEEGNNVCAQLTRSRLSLLHHGTTAFSVMKHKQASIHLRTVPQEGAPKRFSASASTMMPRESDGFIRSIPGDTENQ